MSLFCFFFFFLPSFRQFLIIINNLPIINRWAYLERGPKIVLLGGGLANERSERSFFLAIERISGIKSDKKKLGVTPHFSRSKILNNHQLGMNNPSIIYLTYLLIHPHPTNLQNKSTSSTCYCTHLLHPPPSANIRGKVQHPWILKKKKKNG